ncbi:MAG TPA: substrate-binding domain-containing protein, partial [Pirellulaceae bacterium]|nr:substrate-binding domain-containing protein [Pirellulaceae bacterium]
AQRLVPSVAAALAIARALQCSVETLFGHPPAADGGTAFAWMPASFPCRYWAAELGGRILLYPLESGPQGGLLHDGIARGPGDLPANVKAAPSTLVLASCDPAAGYLAEAYRRQGGFRMLVFSRTSTEALALVERRLVHVAGVHFSAGGSHEGNARALARHHPATALSLVRVARWEEGLAVAPASRLRTATAAVRSKLRWIGRPAGAGARRCQDELLGKNRAPRLMARDHRGIVEAIRSGWADVGVCVRLASEEGQLGFLPVCEEPYDLCFRSDAADDPRLRALVATLRSATFREIIDQLPGYRAADTGDLVTVES